MYRSCMQSYRGVDCTHAVTVTVTDGAVGGSTVTTTVDTGAGIVRVQARIFKRAIRQRSRGSVIAKPCTGEN